MRSRLTALLVVVLVVSSGSLTGAALAPADTHIAQRGGGDGGDGQRTPMGGDGQRTPGGGDGGDGQRTPMGGDGGDGRANVSVDHSRPGHASVMVHNAAANRTVHIRFERMVASPETGIRVREMSVTAGDSAFQLTVRATTRASVGVNRFEDASPFGYLNVTHTVPNANVTNASFTFALNRTRLRERNLSAENVSLYRYRATNRTWHRLQTRVVERNQTRVLYRAESPGLSEFVVAPTVETATPTATATPTPTATPPPTTRPPTTTATSTPTPMEGTGGDGPGFGLLAAMLALVGLGFLSRRR